jgi:tripartite-type tricarboxylate transporter receptor subunit TctC
VSKVSKVNKVFRRLAACALTLALGAGTHSALAEEYPSRPVSVVVTFPAGGVVDVIARAVMNEAGPKLGQPVVIVNKPGGDNLIGINAVLQAPADGYTLLTAGPFIETTPLLRKNPGFKTSDFMPVAMFGSAPNVIVTSPMVPVKTLKEFVAYARARPGKLNMATSFRSGTSYQTLMAVLQATGIDLQPVTFKGAAEMIPSLASGDVQLGSLPATVAAPAIRSGKLKALAVTSEQRFPSLPEVPTATEAGLPRGSLPLAWYGLVAKAGTPAAIVARWNREINAALKTPELVQQLAGFGMIAAPESLAEFRQRIGRDQARWAALFKARNIQPE